MAGAAGGRAEEKIISRHAGTVAWLRERGVEGEVIPQLDESTIHEGDILYGVLPVPLIATALERGARVILTVLPQVVFSQRGIELSPAEMDAAGAKLVEVRRLELEEVR